MSYITDTHCHLNYKWFEDDVHEVIQRAFDNGISRILIPGIDLASCHTAITLCEKYDGIFAAVGIHPNDATTWQSVESWAALESLAKHPKVIAIGEIGLDFYRLASGKGNLNLSWALIF